MLTLLCDDSIDGVFSAIYEAWAGGYNRDELMIRIGDIWNYELFMEYKHVKICLEHSNKVGRTLRRMFGEEVYEDICYALWTRQEDRADAVFKMVKYGIEHKYGRRIRNHLTHNAAERVFELSRSTSREAHHYLGFIRFARLQSGILYAQIEADNYVLEAVATHFADRLAGEDWIIHDSGYAKAVVHRAYKGWIIAEEKKIDKIIARGYACEEEEIRHLWRNFCDSVAIQARINPKLQCQNLPQRFRKYMI